jgi:hypothetical protein
MLPKLLTSIFGSRNERLLKQNRRVVDKINAMEPQFEALDDAALRADLRRPLLGDGATGRHQANVRVGEIVIVEVGNLQDLVTEGDFRAL